jgi:chromosome segregation ATPase
MSQIECPFRVLDEYDVFLDEISRKMTLNRLLTYAREDGQIGRQMIIITPHNLQGVVTTNDVRIKKMAAPERSASRGPQQTTLDF